MKTLPAKIKKYLSVAGLIAVITGCAAVQEPLSVDQSIFEEETRNRVAIVMTPLPEPDVLFPGAGCLLCVLTAEGLHTSLSTHTDTLDGSEFKLSKTQLAERLREKGVDPIVVDEPLTLSDLTKFTSKTENSAAYDFSEFAAAYDADYVVVIAVSGYGFAREFASYVPTTEPVAIFNAKGFMIDPSSNTYVWYQEFDMAKGVEGDWNQAPDFPKLTNAFHQLLAEARDSVLAEF